MANPRALDKRRKSIRNIRKITRTMELIATAKSQVCMNRIKRALPYFHALAEIAELGVPTAQLTLDTGVNGRAR